MTNIDPRANVGRVEASMSSGSNCDRHLLFAAEVARLDSGPRSTWWSPISAVSSQEESPHSSTAQVGCDLLQEYRVPSLGRAAVRVPPRSGAVPHRLHIRSALSVIADLGACAAPIVDCLAAVARGPARTATTMRRTRGVPRSKTRAPDALVRRERSDHKGFWPGLPVLLSPRWAPNRGP